MTNQNLNCSQIIDYWNDFIAFRASNGVVYIIDDGNAIRRSLLTPYRRDRIYNGTGSEAYMYEPAIGDLEDWQLKEFVNNHRQLWKVEEY